MHKLDDDVDTAMPRRPADDEYLEPLNIHDHTEP
jgi:hypothetical protein